MNPDGKSRRACTLLKVGRGQPARPMVEQRPLFNYWAILMPHFRGVLLPPQNRSDESIQWAWTEIDSDDPVSATELATIRKRLAVAQQSLSESLEDAAGQSAKAATFRATKDRMDEIVGALVALPDAALAGFVARTDRGMLLHSWGLANPLSVQYLDTDLELTGRVLVAGAPASGQKVILEAAGGSRVAETTTDAAGSFGFAKVAAGSYRVRAVSRPPDVIFPERGEVFELFGSSITTIEIRNEDRKRSTVLSPQSTASGRYAWGIGSAVAVLLAIAAYYFWSGKAVFSNSSTENERPAWEVNVAPRSVAQHNAANSEGSERHSASTATEPTAPIRQAANAPRTGLSPQEASPERGHSRAKAIVAAKQTSGLPDQQEGMPAGGRGAAGGGATSARAGAAGGGQAGDPGSGAGTGGASGSSGASAGAAPVPVGPAVSPSASAPQAAAIIAPPDGTPAATQPRGSRRPEASTPSAAAFAEKKRATRSAVTDARSAKDIAAANTPAAIASDKTATAADASSDAPTSTAGAPVPELPDGNIQGGREADEEKKPDGRSAPSDKSEDRQTQISSKEMALQVAPFPSGSDSPLPAARMSLRPSPWRRLLLRDAIVPTLPTRVGQNDAMNDLSARVLAEKQTSIPRTLLEARMVVGVRLEFPARFTGSELRWEVVNGDVPLVSGVDKDAAELGWSEGVVRGTYVLVSANGRKVVSISADPQDGIRVWSTDAIQSWPWVGVECAAGEADRLDWQVMGTSPMPSSWIQNNRWMNGRGLRLDLRSSTTKNETVMHPVALVDAASGWALASKLEHQQVVAR